MLNASRTRHLPDVAASVTLRPLGSGPVTVTQFEPSIQVATANTRFWETGNQINIPKSMATINITALSGSPSLELWLASSADMVSSAVRIGLLTGLSIGPEFRMAVPLALVAQFAGSVFLAVKTVAAGASITYSAQLVPELRP